MSAHYICSKPFPNGMTPKIGSGNNEFVYGGNTGANEE